MIILQKLLTLTVVALVISGCAAEDSENHGIQVCQGFGCSTKFPEGKDPYDPGMLTHKATKEEKLRIMQGEKPDFGSSRINVKIF